MPKTAGDADQPTAKLSRLRDAVWPRMGLKRYATYLQKKVLRLSATPHAVAAGVAAGATVSVFPLIGVHFLLGFAVAFLTRGNMIAAAMGTAFGNPLTFPIFFSIAYQIGTVLTGGTTASAGGEVAIPDAEALSQGLFSLDMGPLLTVFGTMMVGAIPVAIVTWLGFYFGVRALVQRFQDNRRARRQQGQFANTARQDN